MKKVKAIGEKCWSLTTYISAALMAAVVLLVITNVVLRSINAEYSIIGTTELVRYFMCISAAFALAQNEWVDGNVRVTIVLEMISVKARRVLDLVCYIIASIGFIPITFFLCEQAIDTFIKGTQTTDLFMPMWVFSAFMALGFILLTICFWMRTILKFGALKDPIEAEE